MSRAPISFGWLAVIAASCALPAATKIEGSGATGGAGGAGAAGGGGAGGAPPQCAGPLALDWVRVLGDAPSMGPDHQLPGGVAVSSSGPVVVGQYRSGSLGYGQTAISVMGNRGLYVAWLSATGDLEAAATAPSADVQPTDVAMRASGAVIAAGYFVESLTLPGNLLTGPSGETEAFYAVLERDGSVATFTGEHGFYDGAGRQALQRVAELNGNVIGTGYADQTITIGMTTLIVVNDRVNFAGRLSGSQWAKDFQLDTSSHTDIALTDAGDILLAGSYQFSSAIFDATVLPLQGELDMFMAKLGGDGQVLRATRYGGGDADGATSVAISSSGLIALAGAFQSANFLFDVDDISTQLDLSGDPGIASDGFVAVFSDGPSDFEHEWSRSLGDGGYVVVVDIAFDPCGNVVVLGSYSGSGTFPTGFELGPTDQHDFFVIKYSPAGDVVSATPIRSPYDCSMMGVTTPYCDRLAVDGEGNVYVVTGAGGDVRVGNAPPVSTDATLLDTVVIRLVPQGP